MMMRGGGWNWVECDTQHGGGEMLVYLSGVDGWQPCAHVQLHALQPVKSDGHALAEAAIAEGFACDLSCCGKQHAHNKLSQQHALQCRARLSAQGRATHMCVCLWLAARYMSPLEAREYGIIDHIIGGEEAVFDIKGSLKKFPKVHTIISA